MVKKARNEKLKQFMNNIAVKTNTVCKGFGAGETRTEVLKDVNFEARMGELLMLVGPSGCGKTTLLSIIPTEIKNFLNFLTIPDSQASQKSRKYAFG